MSTCTVPPWYLREEDPYVVAEEDPYVESSIRKLFKMNRL